MKIMEKKVSEAINLRRSVRIFKKTDIDKEKVKQCIYNGSLAPNSSNLQLWEFYHITGLEMKKLVAINCYDQPAAKTAQELVIPVVRLDLWQSRIKSNIEFIRSNVKNTEDEKKLKERLPITRKLFHNFTRGVGIYLVYFIK